VLNQEQRRQLLGIALIALSTFTLLSAVPLHMFENSRSVFPTGNVMGMVGAGTAAVGYGVFGSGFLVFPLLFAMAGARAFEWIERDRTLRWTALLVGLMLLVPATLYAFAAGNAVSDRTVFLPAGAAGWVGRTIALPLFALLSGVGAAIALVFLYIALFVATLGWNPAGAAARAVRARMQREGAQPSDAASAVVPPPLPILEEDEPEPDVFEPAAPVQEAPAPKASPLAEVASRFGRKSKAPPPPPVLEEFGDPTSSERPPLTLLSPEPPHNASLSEADLDRLGNVLIQTLRTFKVEGAIAGRTTGPVVTQFEVVPAPGVKVNRIAALDADLALALRAPSVRIVAPIPGKGAVGVDVPNPEPVPVFLRTILESQAFQKGRGTLPLALGKDLSGRPYVSDLAKMPHLLIAGATGSGKSVCINTLITSLVYRYSPRELRLLMVDPKMVELSMYAELPHLRHPVVTDPQDAATVLKWAVLEMERRYALLSENGARSLTEFNKRVQDGQPLKRAYPKDPDETNPQRWVYDEGELPYIVVVVDELADLMMSVQAEIEKPLAQLAQKARAIGIHLIVATQRPSVNVITGLIKANFPCRIAFRVSSKVDSRTILDQNGADALLGNGDMLFLPPGTSDPVRVQGAYISTEDTDRLMSWYRERAHERELPEEDILAYVRAMEAQEGGDEGEEFLGERDALFRQAAEICVQFQQGSTSLLQRRLRIGYGRAARIIDQLHHAGVLGPPDGSKPREVLVGMESIDAICGDD